MRHVELALPVRGLATDSVRASPRATIAIDVSPTLFIPRKLQKEGGLHGYEPDTLATFLAALEVLPRGHVFDVGANVGVFSLLAAALTWWDVIAFEPTPELARVSRELATRNGLEYTVEEIALGASDGSATLHLSDITDASNSLRAGFRPSSQSVEVRLEQLDTFCARTGVTPSVLKIDTEATEPDVLRGASRLLERKRPWLIIEVLAGRTELALAKLMRPLGYHWYQITDESPLRRRDVIEGDRTYRFTNWLFAPEEPSRAFWAAKDAWRKALVGEPQPDVATDARTTLVAQVPSPPLP